MRFVIITGLSGAGKSMAVKSFEDMGYYCIDNMPPLLIPKFAEICYSAQSNLNNVAIVSDCRSGEMFNDFKGSLEELKKCGYKYELLFLNASDEVLIKRYKETRRTHPLGKGQNIAALIAKEREILSDIYNMADNIIDTSNKNAKQHRAEIFRIYGDSEKSPGLGITVMSFGFKYGIPLDADLVFDVRFLPNPFYVEELREHTGLESCVSDFVMGYEQSKQFRDKVFDMIDYLIPYYNEEGKSQLVIAVGCTGGHHRSVTLAEVIYNHLKDKNNVNISHRDIKRD